MNFFADGRAQTQHANFKMYCYLTYAKIDMFGRKKNDKGKRGGTNLQEWVGVKATKGLANTLDVQKKLYGFIFTSISKIFCSKAQWDWLITFES